MKIDLDSLYETYMGYMGFTVSRVFLQKKAVLTEIQSIAAVELNKDELKKTIEFSPHPDAENHPVNDNFFITLWNNLIGYKISSVLILEKINKNSSTAKMVTVSFDDNSRTKVVEFNENGKVALKNI